MFFRKIPVVFPTEVAGLVREAARGEARAWDLLVDRFAGLVWAVARGHGLSPADAADVSQTTWLRLAEHLGRIREPERIGVWLATTARHESLRTFRRAQRQVPVDPSLDLVADTAAPDVDGDLLAEERDATLWRAFESLPPPCKSLLRTLMADPPPTYAEVSEVLGMPVGSIGPSRQRCLQRLRRCAEVREAGREEPRSVGTTRAAG